MALHGQAACPQRQAWHMYRPPSCQVRGEPGVVLVGTVCIVGPRADVRLVSVTVEATGSSRGLSWYMSPAAASPQLIATAAREPFCHCLWSAGMWRSQGLRAGSRSLSPLIPIPSDPHTLCSPRTKPEAWKPEAWKPEAWKPEAFGLSTLARAGAEPTILLVNSAPCCPVPPRSTDASTRQSPMLPYVAPVLRCR